MKTLIAKYVRCLVLNALLLGVAETALAGAHTWDVNEVFSNADGTVQFVELREMGGGAGEVNMPGNNLTSNAKSFVIPGPALTPPTSNKHFLLGTAAFQLLPGAPAVDATIPAGSLPFFFVPSGDTVTYGPYDSFVFASAPTNGIDSQNRVGGVAVNSPTNYAGATGSVDASAGPSVPALSGWGMGLAAGLLLLVGTAIVLRSRARAA